MNIPGKIAEKTPDSDSHDAPQFMLLLLGIVILGVILRITFFSGYVSGDDAAYIAKAFQYSAGDLTPPYSHWGGRIFVVLTTTLSYLVFGVSELSTVLVPFILSVGGIVVAFYLGKELFDSQVGLLAAGFTAFIPAEVLFASHLFPYASLSFLTALSLLLFLKGQRLNNFTLVFVAGLMMGLAYLSRVTALYCGLFFVLMIIWNKKIDRSYFVYVGGLIGILLLEAVWSYFQSGEPFYRFTHILMNRAGIAGEETKLIEAAATKEWSQPLSWYFEPFIRPIFEQEFGGFFLFLWPVIIYQLIWGKNRKVKLLLLWIIPLFLYISYGSTSPVDYRTLRRLPRYYSIIIIPCMVLMAYQVAALTNLKLKVMAVLSLAGMSLICLLVDNSPYVTEREQELARYINSNPDQTFVVPRSLYLDYLFYSGFQEPKNVLHYYRDNDRSDTLKRIHLVDSNQRRARAADLCGDKLIVDDQSYFKRELAGRNDLAVVEQFHRSDRIYHKIIANPMVLSLLSLVRDEKRLHSLTKGSARDTYRVYSTTLSC